MSIVVSHRGLADWLSVLPEPQVLADTLTAKGLEVESVDVLGGALEGVVVGKILTVERHPNADRLSLCSVDVGVDKPLAIVCGCSSVRAGLCVAVATVGTCLPGDFKIKQNKIRGEVSEGMLCSRTELGLGGSASGIMHLAEDAPVGRLFADYLNLPDHLIDVSITPNRGDCLSLLGIAREYVACSNDSVALQWPFSQDALPALSPEDIKVTVSDAKACPAYAVAALSGIDFEKKTPLWMAERLQRSGFRLVNVVVDITQYVMLALGQPMHAFDAAMVSGALCVQRVKHQKQNKIKLLDEKTWTLDPEVLLVTDDEKPLAMAGVMGAMTGSVQSGCTSILLESAFFDPETIAFAARKHAIHTDSSMRFERGVDPALHAIALRYAVDLLTTYAGGKLTALRYVTSLKDMPVRAPIVLPASLIERVLGCAVAPNDVVALLQRLNMTVSSQDKGWSVVPPSYRFDMEQPIDLVEEVVRLYGYDQVPEADVAGVDPAAVYARESAFVRGRFNLGQRFAALGYQELVTYSFVPNAFQTRLFPDAKPVAVVNPLSQQMDVMRVSLMPGLLMAASRNLQRRASRLQFFEMGRCFVRVSQQKIVQPWRLGLLVSGERFATQWGLPSRKMDFFDLKGDLIHLLGARLGSDYVFRPLSDLENLSLPSSFALSKAFYHPAQTALLCRGDEVVGVLGKLHPSYVASLSVDAETYLCELHDPFALLFSDARQPVQAVSKFPGIRRDVSFWVPETASYAKMRAALMKKSGDHLVSVDLFDRYRESGADGRQSFSWSLYFQHAERTLTDEEVQGWMQSAIQAFSSACSAVLRDQ